MRIPLLRVIRDLQGRSGRRFVEILTAHVEATLDGTRLVERAVRGEMAWEAALGEMVNVEHRGDEMRRALVLELATAIVTPIDREDLFRVSRSIDDVLDNLRDCLREGDLFELRNASAMLPTAEAIREAIVALGAAIVLLDDAPARIGAQALLAHKAANEVRRAYDAALAELFRGALTMDVLKVREVLRRLDVVGLRIGEAADVLSDAAVKRSAGGDEPPGAPA
jgi:uncharacterized protein Yka (UPF0111/DUF47 family)